MAALTTAALLASSALAAGSSIASGVAQSNAANRATEQEQAGLNQARDAFSTAQGTISGNNQPWSTVGQQALQQLAQNYGLTGNQAAAGSPDWNAYIAQNPDVQAVQDVIDGRAQGTPDQLNFINDFRRSGVSNLGEYHASVVPGRAIPTVAAQEQQQAPQQQASVFTQQDPLATYKPLDVSVGSYQQSPGYQFQLDQGQKALTNNKAVSGLLESGSALKAITSYAQNLANGDYTNWRDYTTNQYNNDRNVAVNDFQNNRNYAANRTDTANQGLTTLANFGQNATTSSNNAATSFASALAGLSNAGATSQANNTLAQGTIFGNTVNTVGGLASGVVNNFGSKLAGAGSYNTVSPYAGVYKF